MGMVRKSEVKRPLDKPRCGRETNTKMNLKASQFEDMEWINMAYRRV
jgi:hypothetical protein